MLPARDNPFETDRIEQLLTFDPSWLNLNWNDILARAAAMEYRGAVVGPHGSGKTAFCDAFAKRLEDRDFTAIRWFLNDRKKIPDAGELAAIQSAGRPDSTVLLIDGAEFLCAKAWRRVHRDTGRFTGVFATIHPEKNLPNPPLPIFLRTEAKPEMLTAFARRLAPDFDWDDAELREIFEECGGNLREALWSCYDRVAAAPESD